MVILNRYCLLLGVLVSFDLTFLVLGRITTHLDALDGAYPPNEPDIPEITGPFTIKVVARYDNLGGGNYQRLIDFGDGPMTNNICLGQVLNSTRMRLKVWANDGLGTTYKVDAYNALTEGTTDTWEAGIDATGLMTIKKNGSLLASAPGAVPLPALRTNKLIGKSHWSSDDDMVGAVLGLQVTNHDNPRGFRDLEFLNLPAQIFDQSFVVSLYARFDNLASHRHYQSFFDFHKGESDAVVAFSQVANQKNVYVDVWQTGGIFQCLTDSEPLVEGEMALWRIQLTSNTTSRYMKIEKNGFLEKECDVSAIAIPEATMRRNMYIGESSWIPTPKTEGVILGLRVDLELSS